MYLIPLLIQRSSSQMFYSSMLLKVIEDLKVLLDKRTIDNYLLIFTILETKTQKAHIRDMCFLLYLKYKPITW